MTTLFRKKYIIMCLLLLFIAFTNYYGHIVLAKNEKSNLTVHFLEKQKLCCMKYGSRLTGNWFKINKETNLQK